MRKILVILFVVFGTVTFAQEKPITTFILVRHAEKDMTQSTNDPDLSADGKSRAARLSEMFKNADISAVYSTPYKRTQQTVEALATQKGLKVAAYQANKMEEIDNMIKQHAGGTVLVSGHSNTIPLVANYLIGQDKYKQFDDAEYGNIIIISVTERGKNGKVVWMKY